MKKKYTVLILISFAMGVIFSLMLMLPLAEKKLQKSISDDRNNTITEMNESSETYYEYIVLDNKGEEVFSCAFAKNQRNICLFSNGEDYIKLSKRKWEKLTSPFLSIGSDKINWKNINDKVEWTELKGK